MPKADDLTARCKFCGKPFPRLGRHTYCKECAAQRKRDYLVVKIPYGAKSMIEARAASLGLNASKYVLMLILADIEKSPPSG